MNELEKNEDQVIGRDIVNIEAQQESSEETPNVIAGIARRWHIALLVFFVICALSLPAIFLLVKPFYNVEGAVKIAPVMSDILKNEQDKGGIFNYEVFMNTQAALFTSDQVLQRVADDLHDKNLKFFQRDSFDLESRVKQKLKGETIDPDMLWLIKQAILKKYIAVNPIENTELIGIYVKYEKEGEAKQIVESFLRNVMILGQTNSIEDEDTSLSILDSERKDLEGKIKSASQSILKLAEEYGTDTLTGRQEMMIQRITALQAELIRTQSERGSAEIEVSLLERSEKGIIPPYELLKMRQQYVNADASVLTFVSNIAELEQKMFLDQLTLTPVHPDINKFKDLLEVMRKRLEELKEEASKKFDELLASATDFIGDSDLNQARMKLEHISGTEKLLKEEIAKEDHESIKLGQMQLEIESLQEEKELYTKNHELVIQRIRELQINQKRPARMSIHYNAQTESVTDNRIKYSFAVMFAGFFFSAWIAFMRDKADKRLRIPEDAAKRIGIRIIGTTTSMYAVKSSLLPEQIIDDYQTIRANLELINGHGIPHMLVVTSPSMGEGKTTFSVNLATSLAEAGKKVLLIDGDLRKPDVARILNLPRETKGIQDVLSGIPFEHAVYAVTESGLDVLAADFYDNTDGYELLALPQTAERINSISNKYDHVIIDTPPVLSFPDALMWAKIADAVVLTSFSGQTTLPDLKEANERLLQANAKVLGCVVSSVEAENRYYQRSSAYYAQSARARRARKKALLSFGKQNG
ncbi:MAG: polysaccharide biosynthesis tyrosine autokinase [Sedimentisphaerales bacterium]|nr:polysaccharide biosynthesis tyrosine autokinase [Sedimentisphaerales bacterium]